MQASKFFRSSVRLSHPSAYFSTGFNYDTRPGMSNDDIDLRVH